MANLMEENTSTPESLIVNVKDHDVATVPGDLGGGAASSFWKQKDVRIWLYILGAAILVLVVVFALLSRQTSLFQGYTRVAVNSDTETVSEGDLDDFNGSAANEEFDGLGEDVVGEGDFAAAPGSGGAIDINDILDGVINTGDLESDDDDLIGLLDDFDIDDDVIDETEEEDDDSSEPIVGNPFGLSQAFGAPPSVIDSEIVLTNQEPDFTGIDLNSNTDSGVLESPDLQGDTGPSVVLALVPSIFYAVARRRKHEV